MRYLEHHSPLIPSCSEPDELLAHIDDMLADLNTELDFMIPDTDGAVGTDV